MKVASAVFRLIVGKGTGNSSENVQTLIKHFKKWCLLCLQNYVRISNYIFITNGAYNKRKLQNNCEGIFQGKVQIFPSSSNNFDWSKELFCSLRTERNVYEYQNYERFLLEHREGKEMFKNTS